MLSSIRMDGATTCLALDGATDTESFRAYIRHVLIPTLRAGDIVVMDNLSAHKNSYTLSLVRKAGAKVLFLPAYSPDLNPIEMMWSKIKQALRSAEARSLPALLDALAAALAKVTPEDARNWFVHCGYNFI
jgi:transposase